MNRFSKSLAMLLAVLMMFSCFAFTASAADSGEFYFTGAEGKAGEEVTVSLVNKTDIHLMSMLIKFSFDETALEIVGYKAVYGGMSNLSADTLDKFKYAKCFSYGADLAAEDILLPAGTVIGTVTFKILETAAAGEYKITPNAPVGEVFDTNYDDLTMTCTAGTITVAEEAQTVNAPYFVRNAATIAAAKDIAAGGYEQGIPSFGWDYTNSYAFTRVSGNTGKNYYMNSYDMGSVEFPQESWYSVIYRTNLDGKTASLANYQDSTGSTVTAVKNDNLTAGTWARAVFKITKGTKATQDIFKQLAFRPFGEAGLTDAEYAAGAYFDIAAWGLFKDEYSALNYEFPVVTEGITVTWKDGDTVLETTGTNKKSTVSAIAMPTKEGFTFAGWSTSVDGTALTADEIAAITEDTTLYALWVALGENTFNVKYLNYDDTEIASYTLAENAMIDVNIPADPTRNRDLANWYAFKTWTLNGVAVTKDAIALMTVTDNITFKADYTATAHVNPLVLKKKLGLVNPSGKKSGGFAITEETFKGYSAYKYAPLAEPEEGKVSAALHLEGYDNTPANYSSLTGIKTAYDARVYKSVAVRYYYEPGENTTARNIIWASMPLNGETIPAVTVPMTSGKWTYAIVNFDQTRLESMTYASSRQFHLRMVANVMHNNYANGETVYVDNVRWFLDTPNVYTVKFNDGTNDIYEMDALEGETVVYGGEALTAPAGTEFLGWTTTKGSTEVAALTITGETTFYPVFGVKENTIYVSAQGDDANNGLAPATAVLTLKKAVELAAEMAPTAGTSATVVVCGEGAVDGSLAGLNVNTGMITITSKYKENDYTDKARVSVLTGTLKNTTTAFLKFENVVFAGLITGNGWNFLNAMNNYFAFGEGITYDNTAEGIKQSAIKFRAGGESGNVDYDKFGGLPLIFEPDMTVHLASKLASNTNNIYAIIGKDVTYVNAGNDGGAQNGTLSGYTRIEVNGAELTAVNMNNIDGNNAHYALIFNNGTKAVNPVVKASNDGNTYKTFVLAGSEGYVFHHNADVSKVGEFTVEAYPAGKTYYLVNGVEFAPATAFADGALVLAEGGTYKYDYADYKVTFKYNDTTSVKYGKSGTAVTFDGTVTAPDHKTFAGWAVEGTEAVVDLSTIASDTVLVPVFTADTYTVTFADGATASFTENYGTEITVPAYAGTVADGQEFAGWKNTASEEVLTAGAKYTVIGNASFEAKFEAKTVSNIEPDDATIPTDVVITVEEKEEAPSADKITAIETAIGELLNVNEVALSFEITAEKDSNPITELGGNVTFKIYFRAIANYDDAKTYRLFHFKADGTIKEECALTKNADHFAFTVSSLSPFVLAEVGVDDTVVQYIPVATYNKGAKTVTVSLSVKGAKLGFGSFGFAYDSAKLTNPVLAYKTTVAQAITASGISESAYKVADGVVRDTWMAWDGTQPVMIDASTDAVEFATITFTVSDDFSEADFRANPTNYFHVDTPADTETLNTKFYNNGCWRVDIWSDTVSNVGADPTTVADITVTLPTTVTVSGKFEKVGTSVITVEGTPGYDSKAIVTLYAKGSDVAYATATTNEAVSSGSDVTFSFADVELGEYYFTIEKNGYIKYTSSVVAVTEEKDITGGVKVVLIPGDIKGSFNDKVGDGVVDIYDFIRVIRGFDTSAGAMLKGAVDINEDSNVDISDLGLIKTYYKQSTTDYGN